MTLATEQLFQTAIGLGSGLRVEPTVLQPKTFAAGTAKLPQLTPMAFNTSLNLWVPWDADGVNGADAIRGFVWPNEVQLVDGKEVLGQMMLMGRINVNDINLSKTPGPEILADLKDELRANVRDRGIIVEGLDQYH